MSALLESDPLTQVQSFRLNDDDYQILTAAAKAQGVGYSEMVRRIVRLYLQDYFPSDNPIPATYFQAGCSVEPQNSNKPKKEKA